MVSIHALSINVPGANQKGAPEETPVFPAGSPVLNAACRGRMSPVRVKILVSVLWYLQQAGLLLSPNEGVNFRLSPEDINPNCATPDFKKKCPFERGTY